MIHNLTNIINSVINLGYVPTRWKGSVMIMLPKAGKSPRHAENYRPISLLNLPGKVMEKIINVRFLAIVEGQGLVNREQHGFRRGLGTDTATAMIYESIASGRANRCNINIVCRDIKGAFDKVWHTGLICKMVMYHFPDNMIRLICKLLKREKVQE